MRVEWHGQSAFTLNGREASVFIDPFGDMTAARNRGLVFDYPPIEADGIGLLLVTHEHVDHNGVEAIGGEPAVLRSTAGRHPTPLGEVVGVASEHDTVAGTERGPNTIFVFDLDGLRVAHFGDFGQAERPEQAAAIGSPDLVFIPVGAGRRSAAARRRRSPSRCARPGWCRCITAPTGPASSRPRRSSPRRWSRRCCEWRRRASTPARSSAARHRWR
jgi:L-ascorbate metabolism protein UlaG (beta-lactamase superfamily)